MNKYLSWGAMAVALVAVVMVWVGGNQPVPQVPSVPSVPSQNQSNTDREVGGGSRFPSGFVVGSSTPVTGKFIVGDRGNAIDDIIHGTCNAYGPSAGISASSTAIYMCAVTGVASGDRVFIDFPAGANVATDKAGGQQSFNLDGSANSSSAFLLLTGAAYSTTSNVIGFEIANPGLATTTFRNATTAMPYLIIRP